MLRDIASHYPCRSGLHRRRCGALCRRQHSGAVPRTSTLALTNATLPYALRLADRGWRDAVRADEGLAEGVNMVGGHITYRAVAEAWDLPYTPLSDML